MAVASIGYAASLGQQELLVNLTPADLAGQVLGAESSARVACQGLAAALAGALAGVVPAAHAIAILSISSLAVSLLLTPCLRQAAKAVSPTLMTTYATH